ncbi:sigma-70 family RNA polymerase sigma factor (plasmid) [Streptomyces griseofuscus]|uniref:Sigma-70 family RNA polymerase sigma factor n=1 Tax=Streptomyces griseofuscus TaxID=146922 RepID=A0A7H1QDJ4_9ACTN|nr:sigma-70 family RNA polymerase sigma factor [Streptomyces griseofuscus]QNT98374.1 sigma-70 family RNA polymerase sigma factor [Streptomyces griseofuscus]
MTDPFGKEHDLVGPDPEPIGIDPQGELFFQDHMDTFMRIALYRLRNLHDAEDAVMDAVLIMHRKIERIRAADNPTSLAIKILKNCITDYSRRSVRIADHEHLVPEMPTSSTLMELGRYDQLDRAMEALEVLSPLQAQCVQLHDLCELPYTEVAEIVDITVNAAKTNAHRGRKQLMVLLTELAKEKGAS